MVHLCILQLHFTRMSCLKVSSECIKIKGFVGLMILQPLSKTVRAVVWASDESAHHGENICRTNSYFCEPGSKSCKKTKQNRKILVLQPKRPPHTHTHWTPSTKALITFQNFLTQPQGASLRHMAV